MLMKSNKQYSAIIKWICTCDGTSGIYFNKPIKSKTLKLLLLHKVEVQIQMFCDSFIIKR
jgi:hypothetical protein